MRSILTFGTLLLLLGYAAAAPPPSTSSVEFPTTAHPVSLTVKSVTTNLVIDARYVGAQVGTQHVVALIELRNAGAEPICYRAWMAPILVDFRLRYPFSSGRADQTITRLRSCFEFATLAPRQSISFSGVIDSDRPCMIAVDYSDSKTNQYFTATTDVIDWRRLRMEEK